MTIERNINWMNDVMYENRPRKEYENDTPRIEWLKQGTDYAKDLKFKLLAANSKENGIYSWTVATHWLEVEGSNKQKRFVCPEKTLHLKHEGVKCPVCEAKRQLLSKGFTEEDLSVQGKYGPVSVFDPLMTCNAKVVVLESDLKNGWDKKHISILQQRGSYLTRWFVEQDKDPEVPDFLEWNSIPFRFKREKENGKWERGFGFTPVNFLEDDLIGLKEANENLVMPDLWKIPSDEDFIAVQQIVADKKEQYLSAKNVLSESISALEDNIPF